ncbi:MAG: RidA family protein [Acidobacteriaceae bacterium]|nr:RidA family protein [Acidobacteriaceae bacterium]MBV9294389.1 RidA family protein [Acidobacteriaceae bacterium]MBV9766624.1 RidA family protein [Acidobacteriaceae bacterium]
MARQLLFAFLLCAVALLAGSSLLVGQRKKNEEPKTQVLPLPPELPMALAADTETLDFHISPLLKTGGLSAQIHQSLYDLIRDTRGETIIKLRAFVAGAGDARRVQAIVGDIFTERKLSLPVLSIIQVGALGEEAAQVVIEAVVSTHRKVNPGGLAFLAGQTGDSFQQALHRLTESAAAASVSGNRVLTCTCFTSRIDNFESLREAVRAEFPNSGINVVQALRDPVNDSSMCEAVGQLGQPPSEGPLVFLKRARATLVDSHQLIFTGLQLSFGSYLDDAQEAFARLQRAASALQAIEAPVEVNAFSLDAYGGSALRKTTSVPQSTFTVQTVEGLPAVDASAGIEAVLAPNVRSPVTVQH